MKKLLLLVAMAIVSLAVNAKEVKNEVKEEPVIGCLQKAMYIADLQVARSDFLKKAKEANDSIIALSFYKRVSDIDMRIAQLSYELREAILSLSEEEKDANEMEFVRQIAEDIEK